MTTLKKRSDFSKIRKLGKKVYIENWGILNYSLNSEETSRFGWTISRFVGSAVVRNKLKRWCRVYFKEAQFTKNYDMNVIFRETNDKDFYKTITYKDFQCCMDRSLKKLK